MEGSRYSNFVFSRESFRLTSFPHCELNINGSSLWEHFHVDVVTCAFLQVARTQCRMISAVSPLTTTSTLPANFAGYRPGLIFVLFESSPRPELFREALAFTITEFRARLLPERLALSSLKSSIFSSLVDSQLSLIHCLFLGHFSLLRQNGTSLSVGAAVDAFWGVGEAEDGFIDLDVGLSCVEGEPPKVDLGLESFFTDFAGAFSSPVKIL